MPLLRWDIMVYGIVKLINFAWRYTYGGSFMLRLSLCQMELVNTGYCFVNYFMCYYGSYN